MTHRSADGVKNARRPDVLVLCHHALDETWPAELSVAPRNFERQLDFLLERGYHATTFTDAVVEPRANRTLAITFDDAFRSVIELAFPLLAERGLVATVFVPTSFVEEDRPAAWDGVSRWLGTAHESKMRPLSPSELVELAESGWEIGSHTCTHPHLTRLDDEELAWELTESRRRCGELVGSPCFSLAYPYGDFDERVLRAVETAGYRAAGTVPTRFHPATALAWPRIGIWHGDTDRTFALKISPAVRRVRRSPLWSALDGARLRWGRLRR
jgi:peptidoglycan/xylan/chitin deacetylase (PgdA/CDA1 family)